MAKYAAQDPRVVAAKGDRSWQEYTSARKAHYERQLAEALRRPVSQRAPYRLHLRWLCRETLRRLGVGLQLDEADH